jgi:hypothetical protein
MLRRVALVRTDVLEEPSTSIIRVTNCELDTTVIKIPSVNVISKRISIDLLYIRMTTDVKYFVYVKYYTILQVNFSCINNRQFNS